MASATAPAGSYPAPSAIRRDDGIGKRTRLESEGGKTHARSERALSANYLASYTPTGRGTEFKPRAVQVRIQLGGPYREHSPTGRRQLAQTKRSVGSNPSAPTNIFITVNINCTQTHGFRPTDLSTFFKVNINSVAGNNTVIKEKNNMKCENCGEEHDGSYGSGRFCSKHCKCSFNAKKCKKYPTK